MRYPDFLIIGAGKSGTTSLFNYLGLHPSVLLPSKKELWFLQLCNNPNKEILNRLKHLPLNQYEYFQYFKNIPSNKLTGEASPSYFLFPEYTIKSIKEHFPKKSYPKIILILREPFEKIVSQYRFNILIGTETKTLEKALKLEKARIQTNKHSIGLQYIRSSLYYNSVLKFQKEFENVCIVLFEDLKNNPSTLIYKIFEFLDLNPEINLNAKFYKIYNSSDVSRFSFLKRRIIALSNIVSGSIYPSPIFKLLPPKMQAHYYYNEHSEQNIENISSELLEELKTIFLKDVSDLQKSTELDLSKWLHKYSKN